MKTYSTAEVAQIVGIHRVTLQNWALTGKVPEPKRLDIGGILHRIWTGRES